jgi:hypothetical protein
VLQSCSERNCEPSLLLCSLQSEKVLFTPSRNLKPMNDDEVRRRIQAFVTTAIAQPTLSEICAAVGYSSSVVMRVLGQIAPPPGAGQR